MTMTNEYLNDIEISTNELDARCVCHSANNINGCNNTHDAARFHGAN